MTKQNYFVLFFTLLFSSHFFIKAAEYEKSALTAANLATLPKSGSVDYFTGNLGKKIAPPANSDSAQIAALAKRKGAQDNGSAVSDDEKETEIKRRCEDSDSNDDEEKGNNPAHEAFITPANGYHCPLCTSDYSKKSPKHARAALLNHYAREHRDQVPLKICDLKCTECKETFYTGKERKAHMKKQHKKQAHTNN